MIRTSSMTGRERILAAVRHEEPDRVPISPRISYWLLEQYGSSSLETVLRSLPDMDVMHVVGDGTLDCVESCPDDYQLPGVRVEQRKHQEGDYLVVERTFHTPAGRLSDRTKIPPARGRFGMSPNPIKTEHLVKCRDDLPALRYLLTPVSTDFEHVRRLEAQAGERGVVLVTIRGALDHNAGYARDMQDLMLDYYDDRAFFDELLGIFHQRSLARIKAALEAGVRWIFGSWYFHSLSAGWSPRIFQEVFVPLIREHVDLTHRYGAYYDYYDDGKLAGTMALIAGAGVDVLETCTPPPVGDFNLAQAKATIGQQTTLKGYVDLLYVVKHGTPELIRETVRQAMAVAKPGGGFIIGSSDSFRDGTPPENVWAYFTACKEYGRYGA